ncbi:MAG: nicotinate-nucleotide adenylyltransferase [bacterium]|nr:nicotinate-nucleotide adenylyltransferase [bacterium]
MNTLAIFGGTFDPVHNGHIEASKAVQTHFHFDAYNFLPCNIPSIKPPTIANAQQRIDMLRLALKNFKQFNIDLREIKHDTPSYMIDTLYSFREEYKDTSITLIIGYDAFLSLPKWHKWQEIITLANLLVINRQLFSDSLIPKEIQELIKQHKSTNKLALLSNKFGVIYEFDAGNYPISSTLIKKQLKQNNNVEALLPKEISDYIKQWGLYQ